MTKPFSPDEVRAATASAMPDFVFEAVNLLLAKELSFGYAVLRQNDVVKAIKKARDPKLLDVHLKDVDFDNSWLNFEEAYRQQGWKVDYDKPGYNESYEPTYSFKEKK